MTHTHSLYNQGASLEGAAVAAVQRREEGGASLRQGEDQTTATYRVIGYSWWFLLCVDFGRGALVLRGVAAAVL